MFRNSQNINQIYGSARLGALKTKVDVFGSAYEDYSDEITTHAIGDRNFNDTWFSCKESLSGINPDWSHSGISGVLTVVSDKLIPKFESSAPTIVSGFTADLLMSCDYSPFGVTLDGRGVEGSYRWGYQGSEKDDEIKGDGNSYTTMFRQLDPRVARWLSIDPKYTENESPFVSMGNNPIHWTDPLGDKFKGVKTKKYVAQFRKDIIAKQANIANQILNEQSLQNPDAAKIAALKGMNNDLAMQLNTLDFLRGHKMKFRIQMSSEYPYSGDVNGSTTDIDGAFGIIQNGLKKGTGLISIHPNGQFDQSMAGLITQAELFARSKMDIVRDYKTQVSYEDRGLLDDKTDFYAIASAVNVWLISENDPEIAEKVKESKNDLLVAVDGLQGMDWRNKQLSGPVADGSNDRLGSDMGSIAETISAGQINFDEYLQSPAFVEMNRTTIYFDPDKSKVVIPK